MKVLFGFGTLSDFGKGHNGEVLFGLFGLWKEISKVYFGDKQRHAFYVPYLIVRILNSAV